MTTHTTAELHADPLAAALANRLDYAVAERNGSEVADREWLIGTAVLLAQAARAWFAEQETSESDPELTAWTVEEVQS